VIVEERTKVQCAAWRDQHGIAVDERARPVTFRKNPTLYFHLPKDARTMLVLAHVLAEWMGSGETLLEMTDWPIFTEREMRIFLDWKRRHGGPSELIHTPGFHFPKGLQNEEGRALLVFLQAYNWEAHIYTASNHTFLWLADEVAELTAADVPAALEWDEVLSSIGIAAERDWEK
jgi:hypothetical protein